MWEQLFVQRGSDKTDREEDEVSVQWSVEESGEPLQISVLTRAGVVRSCDQMIMHFIFIKLIRVTIIKETFISSSLVKLCIEQIEDDV